MPELNEWFTQHKVEDVECLIPDMTGNARGKLIPVKKFFQEESRLPESIMVQCIDGGFTEEHDDLLGSGIDGDMFLKPDLDTVRLVPWSNTPSAQIIHDCYTKEGEPHPLAPRNVLKRVLKLYEDNGWQPILAPEAEFYFVKQNNDPGDKIEPATGRTGHDGFARQPYSIDALNEFEHIIDEMYDYCDVLNLDVDTLIHESGAAQFEINFLHGDPLNLADQVFMFKRAVREVAIKHGLYATFMAKPMENEPGSAMHIHQSFVDKETGRNIFIDDNDQPNERFRHYIGGLRKFTPSCISMYAPNVNSYRRFTKDISAPVNMLWGFDNRTTGIRVPDSSPKNTRVENRFPGMDANPYLSIAASLACGYLGIKNKIDPGEPYADDAYEEGIDVARSLQTAISLLRDCPEVAEVMGPEFIKAYCAVKEEEYEAFNKVISSWEREYLLLNV
ncbi:glutamine synthetase family protein [Pseudoteredinibacter isoporae]|uniref:Glutamine synthetase n=1 Tax=Pseudoteredinibacter isoporae TaxID=570281 RepID=A0A7X0MVP7_9GAMM|nr:glutamine synthetase family protein [Pseudoteredinibacter isoporae]MBB6521941.1 glutamine synthetase [Pseudoteredinibacter isoporae]NHO87478.1 glutamine synthetase [Pseudoteredinibacter isoporae]NIB24191.1 glutamine synthetase [Pseudoteredinibacter isoporae]